MSKASQADCYQAIVKGFSHGSFTDLEYFNPGGKQSIQLQRDLIRVFFDKYLKKTGLEFSKLGEKYPEIRISRLE